jgi:hypothetical protein
MRVLHHLLLIWVALAFHLPRLVAFPHSGAVSAECPFSKRSGFNLDQYLPRLAMLKMVMATFNDAEIQGVFSKCLTERVCEFNDGARDT